MRVWCCCCCSWAVMLPGLLLDVLQLLLDVVHGRREEGLLLRIHGPVNDVHACADDSREGSIWCSLMHAQPSVHVEEGTAALLVAENEVVEQLI